MLQNTPRKQLQEVELQYSNTGLFLFRNISEERELNSQLGGLEAGVLPPMFNKKEKKMSILKQHNIILGGYEILPCAMVLV